MSPYSARYLVVDLTNQKTEARELPERWLRDYLGGVGLGARLLLEWSQPGADALSPDNPVVFACGALSGTVSPASACHAVVTKSPLSGLLSSSVSSGLWSLGLKRTGFDAVVIAGAASSPVYLFIDDGQVRFRKANFLAGKGCPQTEAAIRQRSGDSRVQVASIGPAGEALVRFATIRDGQRLPHRGGVGAVMGVKKLKAIAVRGTGPIPVSDMPAMQKLSANLNAHLHQSAVSGAGRMAPAACLLSGSAPCPLPARNYQQAISDGAGSLAAECAGKEHLIKAVACPTCPVACQYVYRVTEDPHSDEQVVLEKEALAALGPLTGMFHLPVILKAIELCQFYGLDPVSAGVTVAWAMECFERGLLSSQDTQGLDLSFGSADGVVETIRRIGQRAGLGRSLAEGVRRASAQLGRGSEDWAMHVKGLEMAGCDPRGAKTLALGAAAGLRPPTLDDGDSASSLKVKEDLAAAGDSIGICQHARSHFGDFPAEAARLYTAAKGMPLSTSEFLQAGEKINNLIRAFDSREGRQRADDRLPARLLKDTAGSAKASPPAVSEKNLQSAIDEYYRARGWTADGFVPPEKLKSLGMDDVQGICHADCDQHREG